MSERNLLWVLAIVVGVLSGFAAVLLKQSIHYLGMVVRNAFPGQQYHWLYLITPGIGMLLALLFVKFILRDNIGHGVTRVLRAISRNEAQIKPHNTWSSLVSSAMTIGLGGSVGAEAPIVYTGAAIGSNVARVLGLPYKQMTILLGCGAAGAVAGIFKAPIAGVLFTLEILMFNISMTSILPLLFSSVSATMVTYLLENNIGKNQKVDICIEPSRWCVGAGTSGKDRMVAYCNDEDRVRFDMTSPIHRLMTQASAEHLAYLTPYIAQWSEVYWIYLSHAMYVDGI